MIVCPFTFGYNIVCPSSIYSFWQYHEMSSSLCVYWP